MSMICRTLVAAATLAMSVVAQGQVEITRFSTPSTSTAIPVDTLPPGARALGLAGAFSAVADDATAAEANPAGQVQLTAPEFSLHVRHSDNDLDFYDAEARNPDIFNRALGRPALTGRLINNFSDSATNISFASFVYPWERFVFSAFYADNADISARAPVDRLDVPEFVDTYTSENTLTGELDGFGLSIAYRVNDFVSLGLTVKQTELRVDALDQAEFDDIRDFEFLFDEIIMRPDLSPADYAAAIDDNVVVGNRVIGEDDDITVTAGLLLNPAGRWSASLVYKQGGSYDIPTEGFLFQRLGCVETGTDATPLCEIGLQGFDELFPELNSSRVSTIPNTIELPDSLTAGFAWRSEDYTWLVSFDANYFSYSDLTPTRGRTLGFEFPVDGSPIELLVVRPDESVGSVTADFTVNDVEEIDDDFTFHFGAEKVFVFDNAFLNVFSLRAGAFTSPDRDGVRILDTEDTHFTVGIGGVLFDQKLQVDLAAEFSERTDNVVLSGIYRF